MNESRLGYILQGGYILGGVDPYAPFSSLPKKYDLNNIYFIFRRYTRTATQEETVNHQKKKKEGGSVLDFYFFLHFKKIR